MDRIEDETVRYLFFLQVTQGGAAHAVSRTRTKRKRKSRTASPQRPDPSEQQRQAAKSTIEDFTRNIQRKKEKELADLHFGGDGSDGPQQVMSGAKVGRNDPCPCGSGKKYKKCHGT